ncbi:MAG: putative DNA-binding domain-containing protein, partial [Planctomycetaceae bacterium]|nr:putative DNA-binding domain-containing protein [Planctomycetaceae bacterium]
MDESTAGKSTVGKLAEIQRWLQGAIVDGPTEGVANELGASSRQTADERLRVYQIAYYARLIECLGEEFEGVKETIGESAFQQLGMEYLERYPSTSYTLADLGKKFPEYLRETRPAKEGDGPDWGDFLIDLATLERIYAEVFDGPGSEGETGGIQLGGGDVIPAELTLQLCPSVRLVELQYPVHRYLSALRRGEEADVPEGRKTRLVVSRREYIVRREEIDEVQMKILKSLQEDGNLERGIEQGCVRGEV